MNYNTLRNKPTINYRELIGDSTVSEVGGMTEEEFDQLLDTDLASYYTKAQIDELFARSFIEKEKSGSIVTFDCPSSKNGISEVISEIVAVQSGTGDPSPTNIRPITGWSAVNRYRTNKNMFSPSSIAQGTYDSTTNEWTISTPSASKAFDFVFKPNTQYTFSGKAKQSVENKNMRFVVFYTDSSYDALWASNLTDELTFNVTSDEGKTISSVAVRYSSYGGNLTVTNFQIEVGTSASEYVAPNGTTYTTALKDSQGNPMECYGGELSNENGVQTLDDGYDCFELYEGWNWTASSTYSGAFYIVDSSTSHSLKPDTPVLCTHAKNVNSLTDYVYGTILHNTAINIRIMPENATVQDFKDYIVAQRQNGTPIKVCVQRATPQTIPQDNLAIASSAGINNIWCDSGDITVKALDRIIQG